jgi:hypothetical protein
VASSTISGGEGNEAPETMIDPSRPAVWIRSGVQHPEMLIARARRSLLARRIVDQGVF